MGATPAIGRGWDTGGIPQRASRSLDVDPWNWAPSRIEDFMRKLQSYIARYGPEAGPKLYQVLQSQAAHAGVSARLRRKLMALAERRSRPMPLFPEPAASGAETPA